MPNYTDYNVEFSNIKQVSVVTGSKIASGRYLYDEDGNIISNKPVINAIDIDWNNAKLPGLNTEISTTGDLIRFLSLLHETLDNLEIPHSIVELEGGTKVLTTDNFESIKTELEGRSAFDIAKAVAQAEGTAFPYKTESEWIASLKGERGIAGSPGAAGLSAYDVAKLVNPNIGTQEQWVASLQGKSAYEVAYSVDPSIGTPTQWVASLQGKSAFDTAKEVYENEGKQFPYKNEQEWMDAVNAGNDAVNTIDEKLSLKQNVLTQGSGITIQNNVISSNINTWLNILSE